MRVLLVSIVVLMFSSCLKEKTEGVLVVNPTIFEQKMGGNEVQLIDARTPEEFEENHIVNAININILEDDFASKVEILDKDKLVLVYCQSGIRSAKAAKKLKELGFKKIIDLEGGIGNWMQEEKPIIN